MNRWVNHSLCVTCWNILNPDRVPVAIKKEFAKTETCCRCGVINNDGIYVRGTSDQYNYCKHEEDK